MKRFVSLLMVAIMIPCMIASAATVDLSGMNYKELVQLQKQVQLAIWNSSDWESVEVPPGLYKVGEDIPAGHWTVKVSNPKNMYASVQWYKKVGTSISYGDGHGTAVVIGNKSSLYSAGCQTQCSFQVYDGWYIQIGVCSVIFTPYAGTAFTFKKK